MERGRVAVAQGAVQQGAALETHLSSLSETHLGVVLTARYQTAIGRVPVT